MRAVIFGGTGQDASYLSELLLDLNYEVHAVARRTSLPNDRRVRHLVGEKGFHLVQGDVTDFPCVFRLLSDVQPDEVYNLAAQSHVGTSFNQPVLTWAVTAGGALNILEAVRLMVDRPRVYQASSSEMFGSSCSVDEEGPYQDERTPMLPNSPYGVAKLAAHHLCRVYRESYGMFVCSGILHNHESPRRGEEFVTRKITRWLGRHRSCLLGKKSLSPELLGRLCSPKLRLGNLDSQRDWGHARDHVRAMHMMLQADRPDDYVVSTGETHTVREFLLLAWELAGLSDVDLADHLVIDTSLFRPYEVPVLLGDYSHAHEVLGWSPRVGFRELVQEMVSNDVDLAEQEY